VIRYLTLDEVLFLHERQLSLFGGPPGVRDAGQLEAALAQPRMNVFGREPHETLVVKAAAYLFHLAQNHPFVDGNKRTALNAALLFLALNDIQVDVDPDDAAEFVLRVASGDVGKDEVSLELERWLVTG